jgi:thymidylate synthase (FAD)
MIKLIAHTIISADGWNEFDVLGFRPSLATDPDILPEFAGRNCYQSFPAPNPATANNKDYLANIIKIGHESVLEHASATFLVKASRNWLLEAERHRHFSWSVLSTRYVSASKMSTIIHPNTPGKFDVDILDISLRSNKLYDRIYKDMVDNGWENKKAREVARQVLPGNTETIAVMTGNMRAWRYMINLRSVEGADQEFQDLSKELLTELKKIAPNSFQDMDI